MSKRIAWRKVLVVAGVSLAAAGISAAIVRDGIRRRCKKVARRELDRIPLATAAWKDKTTKEICVGERSQRVAPAPKRGSSLSARRAANEPRGARQRPGQPVSQRNVATGTIVTGGEGGDSIAEAFATGADSVYLSRDGKGYHAMIGAHRFDSDGKGRTHTQSADAHGKGRDPEAAIRDAIAKIRDLGDAVEPRAREPVPEAIVGADVLPIAGRSTR